jgi:cardiolipin synthase (CMP-forming)
MTAVREKPNPPTIMTIPNVLTFLRLGIVPFFVAATLAERFTLAFVLFVVAGVSDAFDGYLARRLNQRSRLGAILDPAADKLLMVSAYGVYTFVGVVRHQLPIWLTFPVLLRDVTIVIFAYLLYTRIGISRFPPSFAGKLSTVFQVITLSFAVGANGFLAPVTLPVLPLLFQVTVVITLYSSIDYFWRGEAMFLREVREIEGEMAAAER